MAKAIERISPAPIPAGRAGFFPAPFQFVLTGEDNLRVSIVNAVTDAQVALTGRFLRAGEEAALAFAHTFTPNATGVATAFDVGMGAGVILNLVARAVGVQVERGECYVRVDVIRGLTGATIVLGTLLAGYVGSWAGIAWPGSPLESPVDGRGRVKLVQAADPPPGNNATLTIPGQARWRVIAANYLLATDATPATRNPYLQLVQGGTIVYQSESSLAQLASQQHRHNWAAGGVATTGPSALNGQGVLPVEGYVSNRGGLDALVQTVVAGLQLGDQVSDLVALVEEWRNPVTILS